MFHKTRELELPALHIAIEETAKCSNMALIHRKLEAAFNRNGRHLNKSLSVPNSSSPDKMTPLMVAVQHVHVEAIRWLLAKKNVFRPLKLFVGSGTLGNGDTAFTQAVKFSDFVRTPNNALRQKRKCVQLIEQQLQWGLLNNEYQHNLEFQLIHAVEAAIAHDNLWFIQYFFKKHDNHFFSSHQELFKRLLFIVISDIEKIVMPTTAQQAMLMFIQENYQRLVVEEAEAKKNQKPSVFEVSDMSSRAASRQHSNASSAGEWHEESKNNMSRSRSSSPIKKARSLPSQQELDGTTPNNSPYAIQRRI